MTQTIPTPPRIEFTSYAWPDVTSETDLASLVASTIELADGDVLVMTSKVVSKAEGRMTSRRRAHAVERELTRVVARRGLTVIAETRHGLVMAAAGVDASNVEPGFVVTLPVAPDDSARGLRARLYDLTGRNVAVVVTDTAGRPWRNGQTDMAVGCAGILPLVDLAGTRDGFGNVLSVTAPAVADEVAAAADLVKGKTSGRPVAVVRGLEHRVLPPGQSGPGAVVLIRDPADDLFGLGARDAVATAALRQDRQALAHFPRRIPADPEPFEGVDSRDSRVRFSCTPDPAPSASGEGGGWLVQVDVQQTAGPGAWMEAGALLERIESLAASHRLRPTARPEPTVPLPGWQTVTRTHWSVA